VLPGVVGGIGGYGNCLGLPNIGGEVVFDPCYQGNPLVNALCVGVLPWSELQKKAAAGRATWLSSLARRPAGTASGACRCSPAPRSTAGCEQRRPSVQVGDPFLEKLLIEACLEIYDLDLVVGIQDLGGAGLTVRCPRRPRPPERHGDQPRPGSAARAVDARRRDPRVGVAGADAARGDAGEPAVVLSLCADGVSRPPRSARSPSRGRRRTAAHLVARRVVVDVPPGSLADDGPIYARPMREPSSAS
jgi:phosphoribosylformylglycinamidine synthase